MEVRYNEKIRMRNEKYMREEWDLKYFMFGIFLGWFMPILLFYYIYEDMDIGTDISKKVYAVLYKIANIGKDSNEWD